MTNLPVLRASRARSTRRFHVRHVVAGETRDQIDGERGVPERGVALAEEGLPTGPAGSVSAVHLRVEESQFRIDRSVGLLKLLAFTIDAEGDALGRDDVEDGFDQFAAGEAATDGVSMADS